MKRYIKSSIERSNQSNISVDEIKTKIWDAASAKMEDMGFPVDEIPDYLFVEVKQSDDHIRVEVRAELSYDELTKLTHELDPIVQSFDKDAYFEPVEPGIAEAYIWNVSGIASSTNENRGVIKASQSYLDRLEELMNQGWDEDTASREAYAEFYPDKYDPDDYDEIYSAYSLPESDSSPLEIIDDDDLWEVIDDEKFGFRGIEDVGYDNDGNIIVIFDDDFISENMIELRAEDLLVAFRQYGYPVHDWNTNGSNVYILTP